GFLIGRKRRGAQPMTGISMPNFTFESEQAINKLSAVTTMRMEAISVQQVKHLYANQYSPILEGEMGNTINTSQLEFDPLPTMPASQSCTESLLEPVASEPVPVPLTPSYRVPATPLLRPTIPATPLLPRGPQGGLLTRYNTQNKPRRIEL